ncbi:MAG: beta-ketoacyl-ACP synthase II [Paludibacteraceae bacterium]|nr:beta-ketoacyl-ACP synthase II [Paludibacteraceae bacterium]
MELKRVVVTGIGAMTPLANTALGTWEAMKAGKSGIDKITLFDSTTCRTHFAGEVKDMDVCGVIDRKEANRMDRVTQFAVMVSDEALKDSGLDLDKEDKDRIGVIWGTGMGGMMTLESELSEFGRGDGTPRFSPFYIPKAIGNMAGANVSLHFGLRGISYTTVAACASSSQSIADAFNYIRMGKATAILSGGSEAGITFSGIGGFGSMRACSLRNDDPASASRPFSKSRDGFVLSEGAACLVLEEMEHALSRGAKIYAEVAGAGINADAYHTTAPEPDGKGAAKAMLMAMEDAGVTPAEVDYINAHGTSTPLGDVAEVKAIQSVWGDDAYRLNISSTKSMTGHIMGGAGAVEALACVMALKEGIVPPTINHAEGDDDEQIDYRLNFTFNKAQTRTLRYALSNTFGFGGHNACLLFKHF